jgi:hypothetical protein
VLIRRSRRRCSPSGLRTGPRRLRDDLRGGSRPDPAALMRVPDATWVAVHAPHPPGKLPYPPLGYAAVLKPRDAPGAHAAPSRAPLAISRRAAIGLALVIAFPQVLWREVRPRRRQGPGMSPTKTRERSSRSSSSARNRSRSKLRRLRTSQSRKLQKKSPP